MKTKVLGLVLEVYPTVDVGFSVGDLQISETINSRSNI